jgi:UvrD-like helicase C-terminal domain/Nuclease-related domain/AAA domain
MAKLIPALSTVTAKMTAGERRFAQRLESHLEDDYLCWYGVPVGSRGLHPDFVILNPRRGLLVLEVKDWKADIIRSIDRFSATLLVEGREKRTANPLEQAKQCAYSLRSALESDTALVAPPGAEHQGRLLFPWGYGVVLTNISRKTFQAAGLDNVIAPGRVICQDEMLESADPEEFQKRLWAMFSVTFRCLLTVPQIDRVRWHLFPEIRVRQGTFDLGGPDEGYATIPDIVRVMDLQQEQLARGLGEGHRVIHGVAGSGKTMILGFRAQYLAKTMSKPALILCFNVALAARLDHMMAERELQQKVSAKNFHAWCRHQLVTYHVPIPDDGDRFFERLVEAFIRGVDRGQIPRAQYGAVLVDEAHDFEPEWLKLIVQMVDPETNSLLVLYDDAQSINRSRSRLHFSFAEVGIQARGRTTILKLNYRNTAEVMALACRFAREVLSAKEADDDGIPLLVPETAGRRGEAPKIAGFADPASELAHVASEMHALHRGGTPWKDMAVLFRTNQQGEQIGQRLSRAQVPASLQRKLDPGEDSVKLMTFHSSKGLEFPVVFIPFLESMPYMPDDIAGEAKLLYVAMTRATDRLLLSHHGDSRFVAEVSEAIAA